MGIVNTTKAVRTNIWRRYVHSVQIVQTKKNCNKRHPRACKRYGVEGFCRFGAGCAYHHQEHPNSSEKVDDKGTKIKLENLEKTVFEMADKIVKLEYKIKQTF